MLKRYVIRGAKRFLSKIPGMSFSKYGYSKNDVVFYARKGQTYTFCSCEESRVGFRCDERSHWMKRGFPHVYVPETSGKKVVCLKCGCVRDYNGKKNTEKCNCVDTITMIKYLVGGVVLLIILVYFVKERESFAKEVGKRYGTSRRRPVLMERSLEKGIHLREKCLQNALSEKVKGYYKRMWSAVDGSCGRGVNLKKAKKAIAMILSTNPKDSYAMFYRALVYKFEGSLEKAHQTLERSERLLEEVPNKDHFDRMIHAYMKYQICLLIKEIERKSLPPAPAPAPPQPSTETKTETEIATRDQESVQKKAGLLESAILALHARQTGAPHESNVSLEEKDPDYEVHRRVLRNVFFEFGMLLFDHLLDWGIGSVVLDDIVFMFQNAEVNKSDDVCKGMVVLSHIIHENFKLARDLLVDYVELSKLSSKSPMYGFNYAVCGLLDLVVGGGKLDECQCDLDTHFGRKKRVNGGLSAENNADLMRLKKHVDGMILRNETEVDESVRQEAIRLLFEIPHQVLNEMRRRKLY